MKKRDIPLEVQWVWAHQKTQTPMGRDAFEQAADIVDRYPEYFPWEHKYKSIPQEVHDAFEAECYPERGKPIEEIFDDLKVGVGLMEQLKNQPVGVIPTKFTQSDFEELFNSLQEAQKKRMEEEKAEEKRVKKIWDKHYKKYGLKFVMI